MKSSKRSSWLWVLFAGLVLLTNGCSGVDSSPQVTPSVVSPTALLISESTESSSPPTASPTPVPATAMPSPTITPAPTPVPATAAPSPTITPAPTIAATERIAFLVESSSSRLPEYDIFVVNDDGADLVRLTKGQGNHKNLKWSPDGNWLAFSSLRDGQWDIYIMSADGQDVQRVTDTWGSEDMVAWSPNGRYLGISGPDPEGRSNNMVSDILIYDLENEKMVNITNTPRSHDRTLCWSPDGEHIVFAEGDLDLVRMDTSCIDDPDTCWDTAFDLGVQTRLLSIWWSTAVDAIGYGMRENQKVYAALVAPDGTPVKVLDKYPIYSSMLMTNWSVTGDQVALSIEGQGVVLWDIVSDQVLPLGETWPGAISPDGKRIAAAVENKLVLYDLAPIAMQKVYLPSYPAWYDMDWVAISPAIE